jgi:YebC/PmpR family DNA-binding regulatory protein
MSGHSKWAQIKRQKGVTDTRRGQLFTKLTREIIVTARQGGGNPDSNFRLRLVIQKARDSNMPIDNIDRAIKRGTGESGSGSLIEMTLEGYGPNGVAIIVNALTDNKNRTLSEVRNAFSKHGGNLSESGGVAWLFEIKGILTVDGKGIDADDIGLMAIDAGADDVKIEKDFIEIYTNAQNLEPVRKAIEQKATVISAEVSPLPSQTVLLNEKDAIQTLKLLDHLEELDDVQHVFSNMDFSEDVAEKLRAQTA